MANLNKPFGARPIGHLDGTGPIQTNLYYVPSTDTTAYYLGDIVKSYGGADANGVPQIQKAGGTDTPLGIIVGILAVYPGTSLVGSSLLLERISTPSTGKAHAYYFLVADSPDIVFEMQADSDTASNLVAAKAMYNCSFNVATPTPATHPYSTSTLDSSTINTTSSLNIRLMGLVRDPKNTFGAYAVYRCMFNLHENGGYGTTAI